MVQNRLSMDAITKVIFIFNWMNDEHLYLIDLETDYKASIYFKRNLSELSI